MNATEINESNQSNIALQLVLRGHLSCSTLSRVLPLSQSLPYSLGLQINCE
jgi:hypothetical protein